MCSISGYLAFGNARPSKTDIAEMIIAGSDRGNKATGMAYFDEEELIVAKGPVSAETFLKSQAWLNWLPKSHVAIFHNRLPTSGKVENNLNNHPIIGKEVVIVHNGNIYNDSYLFSNYGWERKGEVDSEVFANILSLPKEDQEKIYSEMLGSFAVAALYKNDHYRVTIMRRSSPLWFAYNKVADILYFASTEEMLDPFLEEIEEDLRGFHIILTNEDRRIWQSEDNTIYELHKEGLQTKWVLPKPNPKPLCVSYRFKKSYAIKGGKWVEDKKEEEEYSEKCKVCKNMLKKSLRWRGVCKSCYDRGDDIEYNKVWGFIE